MNVVELMSFDFFILYFVLQFAIYKKSFINNVCMFYDLHDILMWRKGMSHMNRDYFRIANDMQKISNTSIEDFEKMVLTAGN